MSQVTKDRSATVLNIPQSVKPTQVRHRKHSPLVADQPLLSLQRFVQYIEHPLDLIEVSLLGTRKLLMVELREPSTLSKIWALTTHLEVDPLADVKSLRRGCVCKGRRTVVGLYEILDDGAGLPKSDASVGVFYGGDSAVRVDGFKRFFFEVTEVCVKN